MDGIIFFSISFIYIFIKIINGSKEDTKRIILVSFCTFVFLLFLLGVNNDLTEIAVSFSISIMSGFLINLGFKDVETNTF